jgi:flagellar hook assembly protein FlgD
MGQKVASLVNDYRSVGTYSTIWNGMNDAGNEVSSGLYIMKLTSGQTSISNKITLLR